MDRAGSTRKATGIPAVVILPVLAMVAMGTFFGSAQTALSSFSASFATAEIAGLLYAIMGLSSAAAALSVAYWPRRVQHTARWLVSAVLMTGLTMLLPMPGSLEGMVVVLLVLGLLVQKRDHLNAQASWDSMRAALAFN